MNWNGMGLFTAQGFDSGFDVAPSDPADFAAYVTGYGFSWVALELGRDHTTVATLNALRAGGLFAGVWGLVDTADAISACSDLAPDFFLNDLEGASQTANFSPSTWRSHFPGMAAGVTFTQPGMSSDNVNPDPDVSALFIAQSFMALPQAYTNVDPVNWTVPNMIYLSHNLLDWPYEDIVPVIGVWGGYAASNYTTDLAATVAQRAGFAVYYAENMTEADFALLGGSPESTDPGSSGGGIVVGGIEYLGIMGSGAEEVVLTRSVPASTPSRAIVLVVLSAVEEYSVPQQVGDVFSITGINGWHALASTAANPCYSTEPCHDDVGRWGAGDQLIGYYTDWQVHGEGVWQYNKRFLPAGTTLVPEWSTDLARVVGLHTYVCAFAYSGVPVLAHGHLAGPNPPVPSDECDGGFTSADLGSVSGGRLGLVCGMAYGLVGVPSGLFGSQFRYTRRDAHLLSTNARIIKLIEGSTGTSFTPDGSHIDCNWCLFFGWRAGSNFQFDAQFTCPGELQRYPPLPASPIILTYNKLVGLQMKVVAMGLPGPSGGLQCCPPVFPVHLSGAYDPTR